MCLVSYINILNILINSDADLCPYLNNEAMFGRDLHFTKQSYALGVVA